MGTFGASPTPPNAPSGTPAGPAAGVSPAPGAVHIQSHIEVDIGPLQPAASDGDFALHQAAVAWSLVEPIVIDSEDDIRSRRRWGERVSPFRHQIDNLFLFCRRLPVTLIADEVGLGKTISAGLVLAELIERRRVRRTLVLAPKVLGQQWQEELATKFDIEAKAASGTDFDELIAGDVPVVITTYETMRSRGDALRGGVFDMLILDEAHKLRNLFPEDPPQMAATVRQCLADRLVKFVVMLTATPMQNRLWDLYSLVDCLAAARGLRNPFGSPAVFAASFCADQEGRRLRPEAAERLRGVLRDYLCRTRKADADLAFPVRNVQLAAAPPTAAERSLLDAIRPILAELSGLAATSVLKAYVSSPAALATQLTNMLEKRPEERAHWRPAVEQAQAVAADPASSSKATQLFRLIERLRSERPKDWRVLVFTERVETQSFLIRELARRGIECGAIRGGQPGLNQQAITGLRADPPLHHVVISTDAGAEGVNLQAANVLVNVDLPWNPMKLEQRIGRVQRLGSKHATVEIVNLVLGGTFDEHVLALLMTKLQTVAQSIGDVESILDSLQDEDGDGFEERVLELVRRSLSGKDVKASLAKEVASIEAAKQRMKEEGELVDRTLGDLRHLHRSGARPPDLARSTPRIDLPEFVAEALRREGAAVEVLDAQRLAVTTGSRRRVYALEPSVAADTPSFPGTPEFDRLVTQWTQSSGLQLRRARSATSVEEAAKAWLASVEGAELVEATPANAQGRFDGELTVRASASNAFDRYEKIMGFPSVPFRTLPNESPTARIEVAEVPMEKGIGAERIGESVRDLVLRGVSQDPDVAAFTRFYRHRGEEEASRPEALQPARIREEHQSSVRAELVSLRGRLCEQRHVQVKARLGGASYEVELILDTGRGLVRCESPMARCAKSGSVVPQAWLAPSARGGAPVLRHLLARCAATGDAVLPEELAASDVSGRLVRADQIVTAANGSVRGHVSEFVADAIDGGWLLPGEALQSSVSGRWARRDRLTPSERDPARLGLPDELVSCAVSGRRLLSDEVERSALSGKVADRELMTTCSASGRRVFVEETGLSDVSGRRVALDRLMRCVVSGKSADVDELKRSDVSGRRALAEHVVVSEESGRAGIRDEVARCPWTGRLLLQDEFGTCSLTGARVAKSVLDGRGTLREAEELLARQAGEPLPALLERLKRSDATRFAKADQVIARRSPGGAPGRDAGKAVVALVRLRGFLGFGTRYVVAVATEEGTDGGGLWLSRNLSAQDISGSK
jgi:superfamily II DNA or RNA helicase